MIIEFIKNNATLIISIIGCVTGTLSFLLHFHTYRIQAPRLKIRQDLSHSTFYFTVDDADPLYKDKDALLKDLHEGVDISIKVTNNTSFPTTIENISARLSRRIFFFDRYEVFQDVFSFAIGDVMTPDGTKLSSNTSWRATFPFRIEPFDSKSFSIRFPIDIKKLKQRNYQMHIYLHTPRKKPHLKISPLPYRKAILEEYECQNS